MMADTTHQIGQDNRNIHFVDYAESTMLLLAEHIIQHSTSPVLTNTQIILPDRQLAVACRSALLTVAENAGYHALLGPYFFTLEQWSLQYLPDDITVCNDQIRLLMMVEALNNSPQLLRQANAWALADDLLKLFDEFSRNEIDLVKDETAFHQQLSSWYQVEDQSFSGLQYEAELIYKLWFAWHEQLTAHGFVDKTSATIIAMSQSLNALGNDSNVHLIGPELKYKTQIDWLNQLLLNPGVHLWLRGIPEAEVNECRYDNYLYRISDSLEISPVINAVTDDYRNCLRRIFSTDMPFHLRCKNNESKQSPLKPRISIYAANSTEDEVVAVDTQIRKWILEGRQNIAVVTEDRLFARRLRAVLERADINLEDTTGWALSTTRAAATIESLLLCIEQDFEKDAFLDLLKSGHLFTNQEQHGFKNLVYRLEHDIIQHEQITNNIPRYCQAIVSRQQRLAEIWQYSPEQLIDVLQKIEQYTQPLTKLCSHKLFPVDEYLTALITCLSELEITPALQADEAGILLLEQLEQMQQASTTYKMQASWSQFRSWLSRNLESRYFQPEALQTSVQLLNLSQAGYQQFDALIIAGMELDKFPGSAPRLQFFNDQVRKQLNLPAVELYFEQRLNQFIQLLHSTSTILLSYRSQENGETVIQSPWLSAIQEFHDQSYDDRLIAEELESILATQSTSVIRCDTNALPARQQRPAPVLNEKLIPVAYSASSYQQLMDCPYQFFAAQCLGLQAPEEIQQALSKREYGERIHLCLQAFHSDVINLPGPFHEKLTNNNLAEATELMQEISKAVFQEDLQENFIHLGWYHQWLKTVPFYLEWCINERQQAEVLKTELKLERTISEKLQLRGRVDRIDQNGTIAEVIDYKSGAIPTKTEILAGEKIQLPFYSLLVAEQSSLPKVHSAGYLQLGKDDMFKPFFPFSENELEELAHRTLSRLEVIHKQMNEDHPVPAWENDKVCRHCKMVTLCRRGSWQESH